MVLSYDDSRGAQVEAGQETSNSRATSGCAVKLAADEELNAAKLDEMKTALDDLKIVDVRRKPAGLSADLKASADFLSNEKPFIR